MYQNTVLYIDPVLSPQFDNHNGLLFCRDQTAASSATLDLKARHVATDNNNNNYSWIYIARISH